MEQMTGAMARIKASAEGTSQIIKDINEAFQLESAGTACKHAGGAQPWPPLGRAPHTRGNCHEGQAGAR